MATDQGGKLKHVVSTATAKSTCEYCVALYDPLQSVALHVSSTVAQFLLQNAEALYAPKTHVLAVSYASTECAVPHSQGHMLLLSTSSGHPTEVLLLPSGSP